MLYLVNETINSDTLLGIKSTGLLEFKLFEIETDFLLDAASMNYENSFHCVEFVDDIQGYILLQNPSEYICTVKMFFSSISSVFDLSAKDEESFLKTIEYNVPILYKVTNLKSNEVWIHLSIEAENQFQFFDLACFTLSEILNYNVFNVISAEFEDYSTVYFAILPTDSRISGNMDSSISIGYGYIEDDPYWGPEKAIPGYNTFFIIAILLISAGLLKWKFTIKK
jgi:hypothetical protein